MPKLTIYGKQELDQELDDDKEQSIAFLRMGVRNVVLNKATGDKEYKMENLGEVIIKEGDQVIKAKQKDNTAQKIRGAFYYLHQEEGLIEDFEDFYNREKKKLISYLPEIYQYLKNK